MLNKSKDLSLKILTLMFFSIVFTFVISGCSNLNVNNMKYKVSFYIDNQLVKKELVRPGEAATPPNVPDKEGCTFVGWSEDYLIIRRSIDIHALYEENG